MKSLILLLALSIHTPLYALTDYYVDNTVGGASDSNTGLNPTTQVWLTVGKCVSTIVAGDTCNVINGTYDERASESTDGSIGNRIVYFGGVDGDCTGAADTCPVIRGMSPSGDFITIQGFEFTHTGMTDDNDRTIHISGTSDLLIADNYLHDTVRECIRSNPSTSTTVRSNVGERCGVRRSIIGVTSGPYTITAGVNDQLSFEVDGTGIQTITVADGTYSNTSQYVTLRNSITALITGASAQVGNNGNMEIRSDTNGAGSTITLEAVANDSYTVFGWSLGAGGLMGHSAFVTGGNTQTLDYLTEGNTISDVGDYMTNGFDDERTVFRNNTIGPSSPYNADHIDGVQSNGTNGDPYILVEGNVSVTNNNADNHFVLFQRPTDRNLIVRYNTTFESNGAVDCTRGFNITNPGMAFYNNVFYDNANLISSGNTQVHCGSSLPNVAQNNIARNNIWYNSSILEPYNYTEIADPDAIDDDYDLWFAGTGDPSQPNDVNMDPLLVDGPNGNFNLTAGSPARDAGGPLTAVAIADSGSGTTLILDAALPFQDGWAGVTPDCIAVGTVSNVSCVSSINFDTNTVTLATGITRMDGDPVWLYSKSDGVVVLNGSAPDIGAFEFDGAAPTVVVNPLESAVFGGGVVR